MHHRLFFAAQPDEASAAAAIAIGRQASLELGLTGTPIPAERLHVTLHWLGDHAEDPDVLVAAALRAGERMDTPPFEVVFDKLQSLGAAGHRRPIVLAGGTGLATLRNFQRTLAGAMTDAGLGPHVRARSAFRPHVTLLYDAQGVRARPIAPIRWTVRELVLVDSLIGQARYLVRGRWPLVERQARLADW